MHELSICQALMLQLADIASKHDATSVRSIELQIGALSGVEPALLAQAFSIASKGSCAEGARLELQTSEVRVVCTVCAGQNSAKPNHLLCSACGAWQVRVISGEELVLNRVELELPDQKTPADIQATKQEASHV